MVIWNRLKERLTGNRENRVIETVLGPLTGLSPTGISVHLSNASMFAAPGGLERAVLEFGRFAKQDFGVSSLVVFPEGDRLRGLLDEKLTELFGAEDLVALIEALKRSKRLPLHSFQVQHSMNWKLAEFFQVLDSGLRDTRSVLHIHDYHFVVLRHLLRSNSGELDWPGELTRVDFGADSPVKRTLKDYRNALRPYFKRFSVISAPSETARDIFLRGYGEFNSRVRVTPHRVLKELSISSAVASGKKPTVIFSGATGLNKGIEHFTALIEALGDRFDWLTVGIEDYYQAHPLVRHIDFNFHSSPPLLEILNAQRPAVAFLGSVVPETFSYTTYEMLEAGIPILTTRESGNIAAMVERTGAGLVFDSQESLKAKLMQDGEAILSSLLREAKTFEVSPNKAGWRSLCTA